MFRRCILRFYLRHMYIVTYYKIGGRWLLHYPEYLEKGGDPENLERIGAFHDFLEQVADGRSSLVFLMDINPFDGADSMRLVGSSGEQTGGYYFLDRFEGRSIGLEIWMNSVIYNRQEQLPETIYLKSFSL